MHRPEITPKTPVSERLSDIVARNLRRVRLARGTSLSALARESDVARATLYQLEAGSGNPTLDTLFAVASVLGVALSELVSDDEPPPVQIIRAGEAPLITGAGIETRLLRRFNTAGGGVVELYDLLVLDGIVTHAHEHPLGVFEHVLVHDGRVRTGPADEPVELGPGDYICFRADRAHVYETVNGDVRGTLLMHYPPAMLRPAGRQKGSIDSDGPKHL